MVKQKILITGGAGFIGSHLAEQLTSDSDNKLIVADVIIDKNSYFSLKKIESLCRFVKIDLNKEQSTSSLVKKEKFDYIFHLAAQSIIEEAYLFPRKTILNNILSTLNLLEAVRKYSAKTKMIIASSDKAYGKQKKPYQEKDSLKGDHPYEVSKSCIDLITQTYIKTYGLHAVITRCANVYGEGDFHFNRLIPEIIKSIIKKKMLIVRSNGRFRRDYIYVKDVARGYKLIGDKFNKVCGEVLNISSDENYSVRDVITLFEKSLEIKVPFKILNNQINEIENQSLNTAKIKKLLGWQPRFTLKNIIPQLYNYYLENYEV